MDQKTRELIFLKSFPLTLRVYLVPELNVLTITKQCKSETTIDQLLTNLVDINDEGKQLQFRESKSIISGSEERLYKWLHSFAGLHVAATSRSKLPEKVKFLTGPQDEPNVTTREIFTRIV